MDLILIALSRDNLLEKSVVLSVFAYEVILKYEFFLSILLLIKFLILFASSSLRFEVSELKIICISFGVFSIISLILANFFSTKSSVLIPFSSVFLVLISTLSLAFFFIFVLISLSILIFSSLIS